MPRAHSSPPPSGRRSATSSASTRPPARDAQHLDDVVSAFKSLKVKQLVADDAVYRSLRERFADYFDGGMGAEAIKRLLQDYDVIAEGRPFGRRSRTARGRSA